MNQTWISNFCWADHDLFNKNAAPAENYQALIRWAGTARGQNPNAFDAVTAWMLDDSQWTEEQLPANETLLMDFLGRFRRQNAWLRQCLTELKAAGVVNPPVFDTLDSFDEELAGIWHGTGKPNALAPAMADFTVMLDPAVRKQIAGDKTGPFGTDSVDVFGCINELKNCDAAVQWTLFMPSLVEAQQRGFTVESFEYRKMPAMRFIGCGAENDADVGEVFAALDALGAECLALPFDAFLYHHHGNGVDVDPGEGLWGRFVQTDTPVPEGFTALDFTAEYTGGAGLPYLAHFAYAVFSGGDDALHTHEGFDCDAMYDVTRNIMLGQNVPIPYPEKYWTAEVFQDGYKNSSRAYMFSALL